MNNHKVVSQEEWDAANRAHLTKEKELTRLKDEVSAARRELPWVKIEKGYTFEGPDGKVKLADLFEGRSQLFVYHFMWLWEHGRGCPSCSFVMDNVSGALIHLENHDVKFAAVSRGPWAELDAFRKRMGWKADMYSSYESDFNFDFKVSFKEEDIAAAEPNYNFGTIELDFNELHGASVFYKNEAGEIFRTYSSYARGCDILLTTYNLLDMTPKGRNEDQIMEWVRYNDEYEGADKEGCCH